MIQLGTSKGYELICDWLASKKLFPFKFQQETWQHILNGKSGLVNAPTGCGKTYSVFLGSIIDFINNHREDYQKKKNSGLQLLWITPLRALAKDIARAMEEVIEELGMSWEIGIRNGDTNTTERARQKKQMPEVLIITPESLHLLLAQKGYPELFQSLKIIAVDEWHELLGSKRGVQVELAISRIVGLPRDEFGLPRNEFGLPRDEFGLPRELRSQPSVASTGGGQRLSVWGISATIGNMHEAKEVLLSSLCQPPPNPYVSFGLTPDPSVSFGLTPDPSPQERGETSESIDTKNLVDSDNNPLLWRGYGGGQNTKGYGGGQNTKGYGGGQNTKGHGGGQDLEGVIVTANMNKKIEIESIFPDEIEKYPWAGHLGIKLAEKIIPIIQQSRTTLIFINTRGMSERWYQTLLNICPELAGSIALHHGSIEMEMRQWVEENLHTGNLKAVVCTSSLDLGVDFRPVETVIQVGSPKGVARFLQRAGRSGHSPDAVSKIYFLPTHSLELLEAAALKQAIAETVIESRMPMMLCFDVLLQYMHTLAISDGFIPDELYKEVITTHCYQGLSKDEWDRLIHFMTEGGNALQQYDDFKKAAIDEEGICRITGRSVAMRHRLHIGTIVSENMLKVKFLSGGYIGVIEEYFISRLDPGDIFTLAGRNLEFVMIKDMTALVRPSKEKKSLVPSWNGGRMPLSANLGKMLRRQLNLTPSPNVSIGLTPGPSVSFGLTPGPSVSFGLTPGPSPQERGVTSESIDTKNLVDSDSNPLLWRGYGGGQNAKGYGGGQNAKGYGGGQNAKGYGGGQNTKGYGGGQNAKGYGGGEELQRLQPLLDLQQELSHVPRENELLIEQIETEDGFHLFVYPFEGRLVHEAMAAILAYRISRIRPISFSFAMNDYGFELLSDQPIPVDDSNVYELFSPDDLLNDIQRSVNSTEMARRKFRDISVIGGLVFQGMPGEKKKARHLQASASLLFNVFSEYDSENLLLRQAYQEVMDQQMEEERLRDMLHRIQKSKIVLTFPKQLTPFCFPVKVDSMREDLSSEKLEDRVRKMVMEL